MPSIRSVYVLGHNHLDPTWRRCFLADAVYDGVTVRSYADLEARILDAWLALAPAGYSCTEGQAAVLREWVRSDPTRRDRLRAEIQRGSFAPVQAGETVQDSNLPYPEGLIRNFLCAQPLWRELGLEDHPGLSIAWLEDAFGNSANYPQVLRGVGCRVVARLSYRPCPDEVWVGIDGSRLPVLDRGDWHAHGPFTKHPPCPACAGRGCARCDGSGLQVIDLLDGDTIERDLTQLARSLPVEGVILYQLGGEETVPSVAARAAVERAARTCPNGVSIRFATWADVWLHHRERMESLSATIRPPSPELNPTMPGCMVTRRLTKMRPRSVAARLIGLESAWASASWQAGAPVQPPPEVARAWQLVSFSQFHDAITGTHIDSAYRELMGFLDEAEEIATLLERRTGLTVPPLTRRHSTHRAESWRSHPGDVDSMRIGTLDVRFDRLGILAVSVDDRELLCARPATSTQHGERVGELRLDSDYGDAWSQRIPPLLAFNQRGLGEFNETVEIADGALRWQGRYRGGHRKVKRLVWTIEVRASDDGRRLDFSANIDWDAESKRIRAIVGVPSDGREWLGEIPFGHVVRRYDPAVNEYGLFSAHQNEYPILHWAQHRSADGSGVAVLARALPCVRWQPGYFDLSLLRSPEAEFCQVEAGHYEFWDNDGQRDAGRHLIHWSIWPSLVAQTPQELTAVGYAMSQPDVQAPPFDIRGSVQVTAWKPAEDGQAWLLRLHDSSGLGTRVAITFASDRMVTPCDLLERAGRDGSIGLAARGRRWDAELRPFGIMSLRIT